MWHYKKYSEKKLFRPPKKAGNSIEILIYQNWCDMWLTFLVSCFFCSSKLRVLDSIVSISWDSRSLNSVLSFDSSSSISLFCSTLAIEISIVIKKKELERDCQKWASLKILKQIAQNWMNWKEPNLWNRRIVERKPWNRVLNYLQIRHILTLLGSFAMETDNLCFELIVLFEFGGQFTVMVIFEATAVLLVIRSHLAHLLVTLLQVLSQLALQFLIVVIEWITVSF